MTTLPLALSISRRLIMNPSLYICLIYPPNLQPPVNQTTWRWTCSAALTQRRLSGGTRVPTRLRWWQRSTAWEGSPPATPAALCACSTSWLAERPTSSAWSATRTRAAVNRLWHNRSRQVKSISPCHAHKHHWLVLSKVWVMQELIVWNRNSTRHWAESDPDTYLLLHLLLQLRVFPPDSQHKWTAWPASPWSCGTLHAAPHLTRFTLGAASATMQSAPA